MPVEIATQQFLIPFLFVLATVFGMMRVAKVFRGNVGVELILSLVLAFFAATYEPFNALLWVYLPSITWFFIAMFFLMFILEVFGLRKKPGEKPGDYMLNMMIYGVLLLVLFSVGFMLLQTYPISLPLIGGGENLVLLLGVILVIAIFLSAYQVQGGGK